MKANRFDKNAEVCLLMKKQKRIALICVKNFPNLNCPLTKEPKRNTTKMVNLGHGSEYCVSVTTFSCAQQLNVLLYTNNSQK